MSQVGKLLTYQDVIDSFSGQGLTGKQVFKKAAAEWRKLKREKKTTGARTYTSRGGKITRKYTCKVRKPKSFITEWCENPQAYRNYKKKKEFKTKYGVPKCLGPNFFMNADCKGKKGWTTAYAKLPKVKLRSGGYYAGGCGCAECQLAGGCGCYQCQMVGGDFDAY